MLLDTPLRRTHKAFIQAGLRQSMGKVNLNSSLMHEIDEDEGLDQELKSVGGDAVIDGRPLAVAEFGKEEIDFAPVRLWDKEERHKLPADVRQTFVFAQQRHQSHPRRTNSLRQGLSRQMTSS